MAEAIRLQRLVGAQINEALEQLAALRIRVFRDWPYLYDGDADYEARYLRTYAQSEQAVCVLAWEGERVVGAATGIPLADETEEVIKPIREAGLPVESVFYFGESVLLPEYRGRGIGVGFMKEREEHARSLGYAVAMFCSVQRPATHPRRPEGYVPLDAFWQKRGFQPEDTLQAWFRWKDLDDLEETVKPLRFWSKRLSSS